MTENKQLKYFLILITVVLAGWFCFQKMTVTVVAVPPPVGGNVSGYAWSDNIGWVDFNSNGGGGAGVWAAATPVDSGLPMGGYVSMAIGKDGYPVISYEKQRVYTSALIFAKCNNAGCTSVSTTTAAAGSDVSNGYNSGYSSSLAIGTDGYPMIAYENSVNNTMSGRTLMFAKCTAGNCTQSSNWVVTTVDTVTNLLIYSFDVSLAVGADGYPIISYTSDSGVLMFAKCNSGSCTQTSNWTTTTIDPRPYSVYSSLAVGADGLPVMSYYNGSAAPSTDNIVFAKCNNASCTSVSTATVGTGDFVLSVPRITRNFTSLAIGADGDPIIIYNSYNKPGPFFAKCNNAGCTSVSTTTIDSTLQSFGFFGSLAVGTDGHPKVSYDYYSAASSNGLLFADCKNTSCTNSSDWTITTLDSAMGHGFFNSLAIGSDGSPAISYLNGDTGNLIFTKMTAGAAANGVTYNPATGDFSGYAWSDNIGWVSFNRADTGNPPAAPNNSGSGPIAKYDLSTGNITGWMRVLSVCDSVPCATSGAGSNSGGWDGWIRFCDSTMANCNASNQIAHLNPATGSLSGWAWSDSVVGWLMLGSNSNNPPTATNLNYAAPDYCTLPPIGTFSWTFSDPDAGDKQSAYEVQVDNNSDFSSPEVDSCPTPGTGSCSPGHGSNTFSPASAIPYNSAYYWRVKVWDSNGADSGWIQYNNPADPDGDGNAKTFTVPKHAYPSVTDISWTPANPSAGESVTFSAMTVCYATGGGTVVCPTAGYHWTFSGGNPGVVDGNVAPQVTFPTSGSVNASLKIVDADGYGASCSAPQLTKGFTVQLPLPGWKEVPPQ